ncbi:Nitrogenase subunit NifH (ATPase) [Thermoplasmatales archaeon BRNA1]|nr:Nitrogenase subunit NifH (ATPase) [Thermoplasmatales archaeon BRNA1]
MKQIAIYGKGGIGKSTVSANISYQLSKKGFKVAQVGCDPKHDSTRLLLNGKSQTTVLDHINSGSEDIGDTVSIGKNGVVCIETGGPEPGVGCAGRGILTAFNFIENNNVVDKDTDIILYDVLGDVVCGGFAVPLRRKYADAVFIVTSGEFMSLYAANNVLKGIRNFDNDKSRVAGLILNCRGNEGEYEYVKNFADAVGLPIVARIPRSRKFYEAESEGVTVSEKYPDSEEYSAIGQIVSIIQGINDASGKLYPAVPLNDDDLDCVAKGIPVVRDSCRTLPARKLALNERDALRGCGAALAVGYCMTIYDADVVVHAPKSCHYFFTSGCDSGLVYLNKSKKIRNVSNRIFCTDLTDYSSIFGGAKELGSIIESRIAAGTKTVFVVTTCVPGIIGDDVGGICRRIQEKHPGTFIVPVEVDGILSGGYMQAREVTIRSICKVVDRSVKPEKGAVNLIGYYESIDKAIRSADDTDRILEGLGLRVNCKAFDENTFDEIRNLRKGGLNLMAGFSVSNRMTCQQLEKELGIPWYPDPMPVGLAESKDWIESFGKHMGVPDGVRSDLIASLSEDFEGFREEYGGRFKGLRAVLYVPSATNINWLFEIMEVLGAEITDIFCPINSRWNLSDEIHFENSGIHIESNVDFDMLLERLERIRPDMVLGSSQMLSRLEYPHFNFGTPHPGVRPAMECGKRIVRMMEVSRI